MRASKIKKVRLIVSIFIGMYLFLNACPIYGKGLDRRGIWVTVFTEKKVLYSKDAVLELLKFCKAAEINEIYLQVYRAGQAYYDSDKQRIHQRGHPLPAPQAKINFTYNSPFKSPLTKGDSGGCVFSGLFYNPLAPFSKGDSLCHTSYNPLK